MREVSSIVLSQDAYLVCMQHVHTTDGEEVMGLLVGRYTPVNSTSSEGYINSSAVVVCDVTHAVILGRSDKRKDRVEISPEMLIQAQQQAEEISNSTGESVHIVGWYHSHPKITVAPSAVDLRTQCGYQQMDSRFVGIIFSVFNRSETSKICEEVVGGFQAVKTGPNNFERINVPIKISRSTGIAAHNQEAVCSISSILQQEQLSVLQESRQSLAESCPLQHLYNSSVAVQRISELCQQIPGSLAAFSASRKELIKHELPAMRQHIEYLKKLIRDGATTVDDSTGAEDTEKGSVEAEITKVDETCTGLNTEHPVQT